MPKLLPPVEVLVLHDDGRWLRGFGRLMRHGRWSVMYTAGIGEQYYRAVEPEGVRVPQLGAGEGDDARSASRSA